MPSPRDRAITRPRPYTLDKLATWLPIALPAAQSGSTLLCWSYEDNLPDACMKPLAHSRALSAVAAIILAFDGVPPIVMGHASALSWTVAVMGVLAAIQAVTGVDVTRRGPGLASRVERATSPGRLQQIGLLVTSPSVPYRVALATLAMFPVLRYVLAPGSSLGVDLALTAVCGTAYATIAFILTRSARR